MNPADDIGSYFTPWNATDTPLMTRLITLFIAAFLWAHGAQAFTLVDSNGKTHTLAQYKGKWVLVNFWATWCPPCLEEIPDLIALHENKKNNLVVLGVAMDYKDPKTVLQFAEQMMVSYPIILGDSATAAQIGRLTGLPTTYLYNPQGKMVAYNVGALTRQAVENYIAKKK
jgi:thiol-disulfide isomerase/thioredoxin